MAENISSWYLHQNNLAASTFFGTCFSHSGLSNTNRTEISKKTLSRIWQQENPFELFNALLCEKKPYMIVNKKKTNTKKCTTAEIKIVQCIFWFSFFFRWRQKVMNFQYIIKKTKTCTYSTDKTQPNTKADHKANPGSAGGLVGLCFLKICVCSASARSLQWVYSGLLLGSALRNEVRSRPVFYLTACKSHPLHIPSTHV